MKTPNYILIEDHTYRSGMGVGDSRTLYAGTFVRPIEPCYLPKHVLNDDRWKWVNTDNDYFCYTSDGVIPISKKNIREK